MTDCLFECLKEAHLDRYYPNFIQRGLHNCESLVTLTMPDYPRYGVVSMEDRLHLFKLIQIIKSIQGEGVICQHNKESSGIKACGVKSSGTATVQGGRPKEVLVKQIPQGKNGLLGSVLASAAPPQPVQQHKKEQVMNKASKPVGKPLFREKPLFQWNQPKKKSPEVIFRKGSDSPIFKCRKTLHFTDSECESSDDDAAPQQSKTNTVMSQPVVSSTQETVPKSLSLQNSSTSSSTPRAFFIDAQHSTGTTTNRDIEFTSSANSIHASPLKQAPIILSKEPSIHHAYFPQEDSSKEHKPVYVEKVHHSGGYDYGAPTTPCAKTKPSGRGDVGKIQVCIRKRPLTSGEIKRKEMDIVKAQEATFVIVNEPKLAIDLTPFIQQHVFHFDQVFDDTCTNEDVYKTAVKPLVQCIFNRGTATCFAFGQTGAGKTYTLLGSKGVPGLYRLAGQDVFDAIKHQKAQNMGSRKLSLWISYFEIYCGQLFDLLNKRKKLHVRENGKQKVCISGLAETQVQDVKSLVEVIQYGNLVRSTGSTGINPHSSRSHAVLQMELRDYKDCRVGRLSFIDLAGSERAADVTEFDRQTRIEGAEINQSLLALKECIRSIDQDNKHTPYRQSKLTHILRESFVGNSETVMIANIAPSQSCCENTLNTLRYADRVKELKKDGKPATRSVLKSAKSSQQAAGNKTPKRTPPSLFHPSKIPFSSTPKVKMNPVNPDADLNEILENADESPIQGHQIQRIKLQKKQQSRTSYGDNASNEGSYGNQPKYNNVNNNRDKNNEVNGDKVNRMKSKETEETLPKCNSLADRATSQAHSAASDKSVIVKETLSDTDTSRYSILVNIPEDKKRPMKRSSSHGSVYLAERDMTREKQFMQMGNVSTDSSLSAKSDDELVEGHLAIISHLDRVLSKAKSVVRRLSPKSSGRSSPRCSGEQTSCDSGGASRSSEQQKGPSIIKRTLFKESPDVEHSPGVLSMNSMGQGSSDAGSKDSSQERDGSIALGPNLQELISRKSTESSLDGSRRDFGCMAKVCITDDRSLKQTIDAHEGCCSSGVCRSRDVKSKHGAHHSSSDREQLPAATTETDSMRELSQDHRSATASLNLEGKHVYYQQNMEPKLVFVDREAQCSASSSDTSGVRNIEANTSDDVHGFGDLVIDVHAKDTEAVSEQAGYHMEQAEPAMPLSARASRDMQKLEPVMPLNARGDHVMQNSELSARGSYLTQRLENDMSLSATDGPVTQKLEPAMPLSDRVDPVTQKLEPTMPQSWKNDSHVTQRRAPALPFSATDSWVTQRTEPAMARDSHITQQTEAAASLSARYYHDSQTSEWATHTAVREPTEHKPFMKDDIATRYQTEKQNISEHNEHLSNQHTDVADHQNMESFSVQCNAGVIISDYTKQHGEERCSTLSEAISARKVLNNKLTEYASVTSAAKYCDQQDTNKETNPTTSVEGQPTEMHAKEFTEELNSSEKRSWASILSQNNDSHSLQSSQDSGISTFTQLTSALKAADRQPNEKGTSRLLIHADSAFTAISCTSQSRSRSHSMDSNMVCSSCNTARSTCGTSGEMVFMPIEPCSSTSTEKRQIAMPVVITKTVLSAGPQDVKESTQAESRLRGFHDEKLTSKHHAESVMISNQKRTGVKTDDNICGWMKGRGKLEGVQASRTDDQIMPDQRDARCSFEDQSSHVHVDSMKTAPHDGFPNQCVCHKGSPRDNAWNHHSHSETDEAKHGNSVKGPVVASQNGVQCNCDNIRQSEPSLADSGPYAGKEDLQGHSSNDSQHHILNTRDISGQSSGDRRSSSNSLQQTSTRILGNSHHLVMSSHREQNQRLYDVEHVMPRSSSPENVSYADGRKNSIQRAQNELISEHEEQLSNIIALCKQEMRLLIDVKNGTADFNQYLSLVKKIQNIKAKSVNGLLSKINQCFF